jgi:hypothetical protein
MKLAEKEFRFQDGRELKVLEASWDRASLRSTIEEQARADKTRLNGSGDPVLLYFKEVFYASLASCSLGNVPSAEEALSLPDQDLDSWWLSVVEVNPETYARVDRAVEGIVEFRDGSSFRILSGYLPSVTMRRLRLEAEALGREEDREHPKDVFSVYLYPILASCSIGDIPSAEEIRKTWPEAELYKWRDAVEQINPQWFSSDIQIGTPAQAESELKKKERRPKKQ